MSAAFGSSHSGTATSGTTVSITGVTGGQYQAYALFIASRNDLGVTSVSGGGLTWTLQKHQPSGRSQQGITCYTAVGTPTTDPFTITVTMAGTITVAVAGVARYTGVIQATGFENPIGSNTNGDNGAGAGGTDSTTPNIAAIVAPSNNSSTIVVGTNPRSSDFSATDANYTTRLGPISAGAGGDLTELYIQDRILAAAATSSISNTLGTARDWACAAITARPRVFGLSSFFLR